jgi:hypothetical protein
MKIAFTGSSGAGKTTLVKYVSAQWGLPHISGSSGDILTAEDKEILGMHNFPGGGHAAVIKYSALNAEYGVINQNLLLQRRTELIENNHTFVTDRSPLDNLVYFINQVGFHPSVSDQTIEAFAQKALAAWNKLHGVIYVKPVQPGEVEKNHSRVANKFYQRSIDAQFQYWLDNFFGKDGPRVLVIDWWNLRERKQAVDELLSTLKILHG